MLFACFATEAIYCLEYSVNSESLIWPRTDCAYDRKLNIYLPGRHRYHIRKGGLLQYGQLHNIMEFDFLYNGTIQ